MTLLCSVLAAVAGTRLEALRMRGGAQVLDTPPDGSSSATRSPC